MRSLESVVKNSKIAALKAPKRVRRQRVPTKSFSDELCRHGLGSLPDKELYIDRPCVRGERGICDLGDWSIHSCSRRVLGV